MSSPEEKTSLPAGTETSPATPECTPPPDESKKVDNIAALTKLESDLAVLGFEEMEGMSSESVVEHASNYGIYIRDNRDEVRIFNYTDPWRILPDDSILLVLKYSPISNQYMVAVSDYDVRFVHESVQSSICGSMIRSVHAEFFVGIDKVMRKINYYMSKVMQKRR